MVEKEQIAQEAMFCKVGEVARKFGVTPATVRAAMARGELPGVRLGGQILIRVDAVEALVRSTDQASVAAP